MILTWLGIAACCGGVFFMAIAALGQLRMSDTYTRLHCSAKSATLGVGLVLLGAAVLSGSWPIAIRCLAAAAFFFVTGPIGCHILARAAYRAGSPLTAGTLSDAMQATKSQENSTPN
jgi:multicomponent Na+:H+ antiporter subunit G